MRVLAALIGVLAALGGSYTAYAAMRSLGPENRVHEFGFGKAAKVPPGGGKVYETRNFRRVVTALRRELGPRGMLEQLTVQPDGASATGRVGGRSRSIAIDAAGRSRVYNESADLQPAALVPLARIDASAMDRMLRAVRGDVTHITLDTAARTWGVHLSTGDAGLFIANLDGRGLRLPGEPSPTPEAAMPDSLLRAPNLTRVLAAARRAVGNAARVRAADLRPNRVTLETERGGRILRLVYGYDAQLVQRDLSPLTGPGSAVALEAIDARAVERMARGARRELGGHGLADAQYALLRDGQLYLYLRQGGPTPYVTADLHGRGLTWPGRR
jgi:hypothetical protein